MRVNNIFSGEINGKTAYKKHGEIGKLNKQDTSIEDRLKNVEEFLSDGFFEEYFDDYYNPELNQDSALSDENNVSIILEKAADYLIRSEESQKMNKEEQNVYLFTTTDYDRREKKHQDMFATVSSKNGDNDLDVNYVSKPKQPVRFVEHKKYNLGKINFEKYPEMKAVVDDYLLLRQKYSDLKENDVARTVKYNAGISLVDDDIEMVINSYMGVLPRSKKTISTPKKKVVKEFDVFNLKDFYVYYTSPKVSVEQNHELWENMVDFRTLIDETEELTGFQRAVANLFMNGWTVEEVNNDLQVHQPILRKSDKISLKRLEMKKIQRKVVKHVQLKEEERIKHD